MQVVDNPHSVSSLSHEDEIKKRHAFGLRFVFTEFRVEFSSAFRTNAVRKLGERVFRYVVLHDLPLIFFVPDLLAIGTNRYESLKNPDPLIQNYKQPNLYCHYDYKDGQFDPDFAESL